MKEDKNKIMNEQNKQNIEIEKKFQVYTTKNRGNIEEFKKFVDYYNDKYQINMQVCYFHTDESVAMPTNLSTLVKLLIKNDKRKEESKTFEKLLLESTPTHQPKGILCTVVDNDNKIKHIVAFVVGTNEEQDKCLLCADDFFTRVGFYNICRFFPRINKTHLMTFFFLKSNSLSQDDANLLLKIIHNKDLDLNNNFDAVFNTSTKINKQLTEIQSKFKTKNIKTMLEQDDNICFILSVMFCKELLRDKGAEFNKIVNNKEDEIILPLSITKYTQPYKKTLEDIKSLYKKDIENNINNNKHINQIEESIIINNNNEKKNILAMKKLFKYFDKVKIRENNKVKSLNFKNDKKEFSK